MIPFFFASRMSFAACFSVLESTIRAILQSGHVVFTSSRSFITMGDLKEAEIKVIAGPEKKSRIIPRHERELTVYLPEDRAAWDEAYSRFVKILQ